MFIIVGGPGAQDVDLKTLHSPIDDPTVSCLAFWVSKATAYVHGTTVGIIKKHTVLVYELLRDAPSSRTV